MEKVVACGVADEHDVAGYLFVLYGVVGYGVWRHSGHTTTSDGIDVVGCRDECAGFVDVCDCGQNGGGYVYCVHCVLCVCLHGIRMCVY